MKRLLAIALACLLTAGCAAPTYVPGYDSDMEDAAHVAKQSTDEPQCAAQADRLTPRVN